jgi:hypothetical protein
VHIAGKTDVCELSSASMHVSNAIDELYGVFERDSKKYPDMLPVVACKGSTPQKDRFGVNYKPRMTIVDWSERIPAFDDSIPF